jgi:hypothetical protein
MTAKIRTVGGKVQILNGTEIALEIGTDGRINFLESAKDMQWLGTAVGEVKAIYSNDPTLYPPTDSPLYRYIILSEDEDGVGGYNEGLLTNETITGSGDQRFVEYDIVGGVMDGDTIVAVNSCETYFVAGEVAGVKALDQMQRVTGRARWRRNGRFENVVNEGAVFAEQGPSNHHDDAAGSGERNVWVNFDSSLSPNARTSATTDGATKVKRTAVTYFLRVA